MDIPRNPSFCFHTGYEPDRIPVCRGTAANHRGQAVQADRERDGGHLEDAANRRADLRRLDAPELLADAANGVTLE
jgi:hypothetical protein